MLLPARLIWREGNKPSLQSFSLILSSLSMMLVVLPLRCSAEPFFTQALVGMARFVSSIRSPRLLRVPGLGITWLIAHRRAP